MEERTPMDLHPIDLAIIGVYLFLMAMVGALFYLGLKALWATHIFWGWFIICFCMAFQAKWIRRSGVMTFAEWNETRFGATRDAEAARVAAAEPRAQPAFRSLSLAGRGWVGDFNLAHSGRALS